MSVCFNYRRKVMLAPVSAQYLKNVILKDSVSYDRGVHQECFERIWLSVLFYCLLLFLFIFVDRTNRETHDKPQA